MTIRQDYNQRRRCQDSPASGENKIGVATGLAPRERGDDHHRQGHSRHPQNRHAEHHRPPVRGGLGTTGLVVVLARHITQRPATPHADSVAVPRVRLDDEALRALSLLESTGLNRSQAIRAALVAAASRLRDRQSLAAEVAALEADDEDRAEMAAVAELMEQLRA
jgi:hypothetical protein